MTCSRPTAVAFDGHVQAEHNLNILNWSGPHETCKSSVMKSVPGLYKYVLASHDEVFGFMQVIRISIPRHREAMAAVLAGEQDFPHAAYEGSGHSKAKVLCLGHVSLPADSKITHTIKPFDSLSNIT